MTGQSFASVAAAEARDDHHVSTAIRVGDDDVGVRVALPLEGGLRSIGGPNWLAMADGHVWTAAGRGIVPLDPVTGAPGATTEILGVCLAFDGG